MEIRKTFEKLRAEIIKKILSGECPMEVKGPTEVVFDVDGLKMHFLIVRGGNFETFASPFEHNSPLTLGELPMSQCIAIAELVDEKEIESATEEYFKKEVEKLKKKLKL